MAVDAEEHPLPRIVAPDAAIAKISPLAKNML
jgi:hypothetical protein